MDAFGPGRREAFQRRLDAAPRRPDLPAGGAQRIAERGPRREPLALATAMAVVFMIAVVGTFLYVSSSQRTHRTPATSPPPTASPAPTPSGPPAPSAPSPRFQPYSYLR